MRTEEFIWYSVECIIIEKHCKKKGLYTGRREFYLLSLWIRMFCGVNNLHPSTESGFEDLRDTQHYLFLLFKKKGDGGLNYFSPSPHED